jgi:hypothetical protein
MDRKRKQELVLEPLEGKQLLSTLHGTAKPHAVHAGPMHPANAQKFNLNGTLSSPVSSIQTFSAQGVNYGSFSFTGKIKSMGTINGAYVAELDSSQQMKTALIRFIGKQGTVDLKVSPVPNDHSSYKFVVASGTGAYTKASGSGKIQTLSYTKDLSSVSFSVKMDS